MAWRSTDFVPYGVNVGGWFVLEDWFYSNHDGGNAGHHVNTDEPSYEIAEHRLKTDTFVAEVTKMLKLTKDECKQLPRLRFGCESDLVNLLLQAGIPQDRIVELFWGHRSNYVTPFDFARIRALGIRRVRLPLTWCLSYEKDYVIRGRDYQGQDTSTVVKRGSHVVQDPFTNDPAFDPARMAMPTDKWISIPIHVVETILETASSYGIEVLLDIHAFPGGAAWGTFSGVWPLNPRFWSAYRDENMKTMMTMLYEWMESLATKNPRAYRGLYGVTPLNEPAHMRGLVEMHGMSSYDLGGRPSWANGVTAQEVLQTLAIPVDLFRQRSSLVKDKKQLVMNVIQTAFPAAFGGKVSEGVFAANQGNTEDVDPVLFEIAIWWKKITTEDERQKWAVLDIHNYIAWNPDSHKFQEIQTRDDFDILIMQMSTPFFMNLRKYLAMPQPQRLACSEYSASTNRDTLLSITSGVGASPPKFRGFSWISLRDRFLKMQHEDARQQNIEMWFWTYHIRNNINYQGEWSLQHILSPWSRLMKSSGCISTCTEALHCIFHGAFCAWLFFCASARAPLKAWWYQSLGARFVFPWH